MKKKLFYFSLFAWAALSTLIISVLVSKHYIALNPLNLSSLKSENKSSWTLKHILSTDCGCSKTVFESLALRGSLQDEAAEIIYLLGPDLKMKTLWSEKLNEKGFQTFIINEDQLAAIELAGVPTLMIENEQNQVVYAGGYGAHFLRKTTDVSDIEILKTLKGKASAKVFPIYGCSVGLSYKSKLDRIVLSITEGVSNDN